MKLTWLVGFIAIIVCAAWALLLQKDTSITPIVIDLHQTEPQTVNKKDHSLDLKVFTAKLWNPPIAKKTPTAITNNKPRRKKPLILQLIGITDDGNTLRAAIYDPDSDQLLIVANGDSILGRTISEITKDTVAIAEGNYTHYLQLLGDKGIKGDAG